MKSKLIGKVAFITDNESIYFNEWGRIIDFDGEVYYIAIANSKDSSNIFDRDQFRVPRNQKGYETW
jgi:hypothetical protein